MLMFINRKRYVLRLRTGSSLSALIVAVGNQWYFSCFKSWLLPSDSCQLYSKHFHWIVTFPDWSRSPMDDSCFLFN